MNTHFHFQRETKVLPHYPLDTLDYGVLELDEDGDGLSVLQLFLTADQLESLSALGYEMAARLRGKKLEVGLKARPEAREPPEAAVPVGSMQPEDLQEHELGEAGA